MMWMLAASLLLQPVLAEDADLRLVATGVGDASVEWHLDGARIAVTRDGEAATVQLDAGAHELWAVTRHDGSWNALARPDPTGVDGFEPVVAWTAEHDASSSAHDALPWLIGGVAAVVLLAPRRPKRP